MSSKTALVIRATGSQGVAVVKHLTRTGWNVHAFVSDASAERALALKKFGENVSLHQGSLSDAASIQTAIQGCSSVFLTQMPSPDVEKEIHEARTLLGIAEAANIKHIVVSTQLGLKAPNVEEIFSHPSIAFAVKGKIEVEKLVRESGIPWTAIRPGWFNTNIIPPIVDFMYPGLSQGNFVCSYQPDTVIATVDPDDIGAFTAMVLNNPIRFAGKAVDVASEQISVAEIVSEIERASGKTLNTHYRTQEENEREANNPYIVGQGLMKQLEGLADMDEIRSYGIPLTSFRAFLENHKDIVVPK